LGLANAMPLARTSTNPVTRWPRIAGPALILAAVHLAVAANAQSNPPAPKPTICAGAPTPDSFRRCLALTAHPKPGRPTATVPAAGGAGGAKPYRISPDPH
jgi:hypothetical protein